MNNEEIQAACDKFDAYLEANGVPVCAGVLLVENEDGSFQAFSRGQVDRLQSALLHIVGGRLGYKLVKK